MKSQLFLVWFLLVVLSACQHEPLMDGMEMEPDPVDTMTSPIDTTMTNIDTVNMILPCNPDSVYFQNQILPLIASSCAYSGCHGGGSSQGEVELSSFENIITDGDIEPFDLSNSKLYRVLTESDIDKVMPPGNPLNSDQISMIAQWILQGAINNMCFDCDTIDISFSAHIKPTIDTYCVGCHGATNPSGNLSLTSHSEISVTASNGSLLGVVNHEMGFTAMPFNQDKLEECLIQQISTWINEGALDN